MSFSPQDLDTDAAFRNIVLNATLVDAENVNPIYELLKQHLGIDPNTAALVWESYSGLYLHPIAQAGLDAFLAEPGRTHEIVGVRCPIPMGAWLSVHKLLTPASLAWAGITLGPAEWEVLESGYRKELRCLRQGMILIREARGEYAIWVDTQWQAPAGLPTRRNFTVVAASPTLAGEVSAELHQLTIDHSPYRGEFFVAKLGTMQPPTFLRRPEEVPADQVILPPGVLDRIDQHSVGVTRVADQITNGGQHLKRGLLLHGRPGTGKTHTIRYLISRMPDATVMVLPGRQLTRIEMVAPFMPYLGDKLVVVLDDVDLIAEDRSMPGLAARKSLFDLLELLDGLNGHDDVLFVLTTNRATSIEPAVAARPGRIDEAIEVPLPDADCRRRLFELYGRGMDLRLSEGEVAELIDRTDGVTASFAKELLRRATIMAVKHGNEPDSAGVVPVTARDMFAAVDEMLDPANPLARLLLGADPEHATVHLQITGGSE